jgi:exodeoxyribonuclease VII small subunit
MAKAKSKQEKDASSTDSASEAEEAMSFEEALVALEAVVDKLEDGELPLEQALAEFERGVALSRRCSEELDSADRRIEILVEQSGGQEAQAFEFDSNEENATEEGAF